jgi:hypothetical protein
MKEPHEEGVASHLDPESCVDSREAVGEALTGVHAGQPLSREIKSLGRRRCITKRKITSLVAIIASHQGAPRGRRPCACVDTLRTEPGRSRRYPSSLVRWIGWRRP